MDKLLWVLFKKHTKEYFSQRALIGAIGIEAACAVLERQNKTLVSF